MIQCMRDIQEIIALVPDTEPNRVVRQRLLAVEEYLGDLEVEVEHSERF